MKQAEQQTTQYLTKIEGDNSKGYSLLIQRKSDDALIDISTLAGDIQHSTSLLDTPEKLTFFVQKDPNKILDTIRNGDKVFFKYNGFGLFCGYVFTVGFDATNVFKITAYSQTRYLKNETNLILNKQSKMTVSDIFVKFCKENQFNNYAVKTPISYIPPAKVYQGATMYSILSELMKKAQVNEWKTDKKTATIYMIRDNYGVLELTSIDKLKTNLVIGAESLLSSYQFETSIDKGTYNKFKLTKKQKNDKLLTFEKQDTNSINAWGLLQKVVEIDENITEAQANEYGNNLLKAYCKETKSLSLSAIGLIGMNAGVGFSLNIPELGSIVDMYVIEATHRYSDKFHTMDLTVNANDLEIYFK